MSKSPKVRFAAEWLRSNARLLALVAMPLVLAACNKGGGGNGY